MSGPSLIYRSPSVYKTVLKLLYGRGYTQRYQAVAEELGPEGSVLDVCCGDCALAAYVQPQSRYTGVDMNQRLVEAALGQGIRCLQRDLSQDPLPGSDFVVMMGSLYQFMAEAKCVVDKMLQAARRRVIIAEPIRNLASSRVPFVRSLAARATDPGTGKKPFRFDTDSFKSFLFASYGPKLERIYASSANAREIVAVLHP